MVKRKFQCCETISDSVDNYVLSGIWGLPIFFLMMFMVFSVIIKASQPIVGIINAGLGWIFVKQFGLLLNVLHSPLWLSDFPSNGLGGGIVTIASFIPPILFIFMSLAWLEDFGYMPRAAFVADKFMRSVGLQVKAFIPLIVGMVDCNIIFPDC